MAEARPKSVMMADIDVNLDFLTKEEKEALLSKKMDMIRQRNKALSERHRMIEADKKKAEDAGIAVKSVDSMTLPAERAPKPRGRGRGQPHNDDINKLARERPKSSGDFRDSANYEPIVDTSDLANYRHEHKGRGRGAPQHRMDHDVPCNTPKNKRRPPAKEEGPPPDPSFNPLADRRRNDRRDEMPTEQRRHPRNYGGRTDLTRVKQSMKTMREMEKERPSPTKPLEIIMTGKERRNHEEWKRERERCDQERIQRQMDTGGGWRRAWDSDKIAQESEEFQGRHEPAKRPAGRIGSGRFDRGERDDRPRSAIIGKGGVQPLPVHSPPPPSTPGQPVSPGQQHQDQHQPLSNSQQPGGLDVKSPRGRGRGRGRGKSKGPGGGIDRSPRPRTWSGGDDRFVECQKELLVVKFENTAGDNSVEVEYDPQDLPVSPPSTPKSSQSGSTPGRGPTGRTPSHGSEKQQGREKKTHKTSRHKGSKVQPSTEEDRDAAQPSSKQGVLTPVDSTAGVYKEQGGVRSSSHSQSVGDSEEWEDCTESSGHPDNEVSIQDLHLDCKLNPEAPEFLPTSPDFLKTPPGHVKVLNWAAHGSTPTSPTSPGSAVDSSPRTSSGCLLAQSPGSSPGSSASVRATRRRDEEDSMPDCDQPHPPPFLLPADPPVPVTNECKAVCPEGTDHVVENHNTEVEEDEEKFEDVLESATPNAQSHKETEDLNQISEETQAVTVPTHIPIPIVECQSHTDDTQSVRSHDSAHPHEQSEGADTADPTPTPSSDVQDNIPTSTTGDIHAESELSCKPELSSTPEVIVDHSDNSTKSSTPVSLKQEGASITASQVVAEESSNTLEDTEGLTLPDEMGMDETLEHSQGEGTGGATTTTATDDGELKKVTSDNLNNASKEDDTAPHFAPPVPTEAHNGGITDEHRKSPTTAADEDSNTEVLTSSLVEPEKLTLEERGKALEST